MRNNPFKRKKEEPIIKPPTLDSFPDFTKKEIFTQGELINEFLNRYIKADKINFDYLKIKIDKIKRIYVVGSGVNYSCAVFGAYNFEVLLDIISVAVSTGEFAHSNPILDKGTLIIMVDDDIRIEKRAEESGAKLIKIVDFSNDKSAITLNYKTLGMFQSAGYTLRLTALSLLALYFGEKNQVITTLYVKIATEMLCALSDKIKHILSQEFILNELCGLIDFNSLILTGTNVDYASALYAGRILSDTLKMDIPAVPLNELSPFQKNSRSLFAFASNIDFYNLLDNSLDYSLKIVPSGVKEIDNKTVVYDEAIPFLNPILSAVAVQLINYNLNTH